MKKKILVTFFMILCLIIFTDLKVSAKENKKAFEDLIINNISVSESSPSIDSYVTYTIDFTTTEEINRIDINIYNANSYGNGTMMELNGNSASATFIMDYYGVWYITSIQFQNTNGETLTIYNSNYISEAYGDNIIFLDLSNGNTNVENTLNDIEGPNIDISSMKMNKDKILVGERNLFSVKVTDDSGISMSSVTLIFPDGSLCGFYPSNIENDIYYFDYLGSDLVGKHRVETISFKDKSGNETMIVNNNSTYEYGENVIKADLSSLDFCVKVEQREEKNLPVIKIDSFEVNETRLERNAHIKWTFFIEDESDIQSVEIYYQNGKSKNGLYGYFTNVNEEGKCDIEITADLYGKYKIAYIKVKDIWGNITVLKNTDYKKNESFFEEENVKVNLKKIDVDVGIFNKKEGIFITGEDMENDVEVDIEQKEHHGNNYDKLHHKGYKVHEFYEIDMNGSYNQHGNKVKVEFECGAENNGKKYTISHLLANGKIQEEVVVVENGIIYIWVEEFSPFMIQTVDLIVDDDKINTNIGVGNLNAGNESNINSSVNIEENNKDNNINNNYKNNSNENMILQLASNQTNKGLSQKLKENINLSKKEEKHSDESIVEDEYTTEKNITNTIDKKENSSRNVENINAEKKDTKKLIIILIIAIIFIILISYKKIKKHKI